MHWSLKKIGIVALTALTVVGGAIASSTSADARYRGGWGWRGGGWAGPAIVGGLALGALAASSYPGYGYYGGPHYGAYNGGYYGGCEIRRRVHYGPYGPVVRRVRVCY